MPCTRGKVNEMEKRTTVENSGQFTTEYLEPIVYLAYPIGAIASVVNVDSADIENVNKDTWNNIVEQVLEEYANLWKELADR